MNGDTDRRVDTNEPDDGSATSDAPGPQVLLVEDNPGDARLIEEMLNDRVITQAPLLAGLGAGAGFTAAQRTTLHHERTLAAALDTLEETPVDLVLLDLGLPDSSGIETLTATLERATSVPIVVLTGLSDERVGVNAVQQGAQSYLVKDELTGELLRRSIRHGLERYERERQLTALTRLSRDLMAATTADDVADLAVTAARDALSFPVALVCLYDGERGTLRPRAASEQAEALVLGDSDTDAVDSGIAPELEPFCRELVEEVFTTSTPGMRTADDVDTIDPDSPLQSWLVLPLDTHGVLLVGSTRTAAIPSVTREYAKILATNAEAALEGLERERQLRKREAMLESQTESLERLDRVNAVIRDVVQGVVYATRREEIIQVVCDRLATSGPFRFAWIGEYDSLDGTVAPRASAGVEDGYLDAVTITVDESETGFGPTSMAVKTGELQVVHDTVQDLPNTPWREAVLKRGYRSIVSIPLQYADSLYGVLTVYADQPGVFTEEEQAVLSELAGTVAHSINAVESKKALVSDRVVELEFEVRDAQVALVELSEVADCSVTFESVVPRSDERLRLYFSTRGGSVEDVRAFAAQSTVLEEFSLVTERGETTVFECTVREPNLFSVCLEHGVVVQSLTADQGVGRAVLELASDADVRGFAERFQTTYPDTSLLASREDERSVQTRQSFEAALEERLTERQAEVLRTAFFSGYFESPRANSGRAVADRLGISQPTFNEHLRSSLSKLLSLLYAE